MVLDISHLVVCPLLILNTDKFWTMVMFNSFLKYARCLQFKTKLGEFAFVLLIRE